MECAVCKEQKNVMKRCIQCRQVYYCSRRCQITDWPVHRIDCQKTLVIGKSVDEGVQQLAYNDKCQPTGSTALICIKCNHKKHKIPVSDSGKAIMKVISKTLLVPLPQLKLIAQGKIMDEGNVCEVIFKKKIKNFMAFGEECESDSGLNEEDICYVMKVFKNISRNTAIQGLRKSNGNLVDAIILIGNNL